MNEVVCCQFVASATTLAVCTLARALTNSHLVQAYLYVHAQSCLRALAVGDGTLRLSVYGELVLPESPQTLMHGLDEAVHSVHGAVDAPSRTLL